MPFKKAERYIKLRKECAPTTWTKTLNLISEMILMPLITLFFVFQMTASPMSIITTTMTAHKAWSRWIEYTDLRFEMQRMFLHCTMVGGPFITTNDPEYMPYVFADAVFRTSS